jgi:hypothetical protein
LKGASRNAKDKNGKKAINNMDTVTNKDLRVELKGILSNPKYCECCMVKSPMVPMKQNVRTVVLFSLLCLYIYLNLFFNIYPAMPEWYYALSSSMIGVKLLYCFILLVIKKPGYIEPDTQSFTFLQLLENVNPKNVCPEC